MLANSFIVGFALTTVVSAKTIGVTASNGAFIPHSIVANIDDSVEIRALNTSDAFVPIEAVGVISPCFEAEKKTIFFNHFPAASNDTCTLRSNLATFTISDKNSLVIFAAGLCLRGMVLDVNVVGADQATFNSALAVTTEESVLPSTASEGCLSNPFIAPNSTSDPRVSPAPAQVGLGAAIAILVIVLITAVIGVVVGGVAFYMQRKKRRAKFEHFRYAWVAQPFVVPEAEAGVGGGPAMTQTVAEQQPLTASNAEYGHGR